MVNVAFVVVMAVMIKVVAVMKMGDLVVIMYVVLL